MKQEVITLYEARGNQARGCHNCAHRFGMTREFWRCSRVGSYVEVEMRFGGKCNKGGDLAMWSPRQSLLQKMFHFFVRGEK